MCKGAIEKLKTYETFEETAKDKDAPEQNQLFLVTKNIKPVIVTTLISIN